MVHGIADLGDYRNREFPTRRKRKQRCGLHFDGEHARGCMRFPLPPGFSIGCVRGPDRAARDRRSSRVNSLSRLSGTPSGASMRSPGGR